jgi:hypothetical protein
VALYVFLFKATRAMGADEAGDDMEAAACRLEASHALTEAFPPGSPGSRAGEVLLAEVYRCAGLEAAS